MSLYADFVKETVGWETLEDEDSFTTYEIKEIGKIKQLKVIEMFTRKEARGKAKWLSIMEEITEIAKKESCTTLAAMISKSTSEFTQQRTAHLCQLFGMEKTYEDVFQIVYSKRILK